VAVGFLGCNQGASRTVHDQQLADDFLQSPAKAGFDSCLTQNPGNNRFFGPELFLLLGQISQEKTHYQQRDGPHEKTFGLEICDFKP
jgi:hypothetical protein